MQGSTPQRLSRDEMFMAIAQILAMRGTCTRAKVGAVIVKDNRIISTGYVGSPSGMPHCLDVGCDPGPDGGCQRTVHAEANAIAFAAKHGISLEGSVMYCTMAPCYTCAKLMINAGIKALYYLHTYRDIHGLELLQRAGVQIVQLQGGLSLVHYLENFVENHS